MGLTTLLVGQVVLPGRQPFKVGVYVTCGTLGPGSSEQAVATVPFIYVRSLVRATQSRLISLSQVHGGGLLAVEQQPRYI